MPDNNPSKTFNNSCLSGDLEYVKYIVNNSMVKLSNRLNDGLKYACMAGHIKIVKFLLSEGADNLNLGLRMAYRGNYPTIVNLLIKKGTIINFSQLMDLETNNLIYAMLRSSKISYDDQIIKINEAIPLYLNENPKDNIKELLHDYQINQLWKPNNIRHNLFPPKIKKYIYHFMLTIKNFQQEHLKYKIPRPLIWIIINQFIKIEFGMT